MPSKSPTARFSSPFSRSFCRVRTQQMARGRVCQCCVSALATLMCRSIHSVIYPNPERRSFLTNSATTSFRPCQVTSLSTTTGAGLGDLAEWRRRSEPEHSPADIVGTWCLVVQRTQGWDASPACSVVASADDVDGRMEEDFGYCSNSPGFSATENGPRLLCVLYM